MQKNHSFLLGSTIFILMLFGVYAFAASLNNPGHMWSEIDCDTKMCVGNNVGIGKTGPSQKLDVAGNILGNNLITPGNVIGGIFRDYSNQSYYVDPAGTTSAILNGRVGIGTTTPRSTLDVAGNIRGANAAGNLSGVNPATIEAGQWANGYDAIRGYTGGTNSSAIIGVATGTGPYAPNYGLYSWGAVVINRSYGNAGNGDISESNLYFSGYNHGIFWGDSGPVFNRDNNLPHIESTGDGNLWLSAGADGGTVYLQTSYRNGDVAEYYKKKSGEKIEVGDVVSIAEDEDEKITLSKKEYDSKVIGIVSTNPGLIIGVSDPKKELVPLALVGRVPCKVTNMNGQIKRGDLLTTSSIPGYAMKATTSGPIIGKALQNFNEKKGKILIFANTSWYSGSN